MRHMQLLKILQDYSMLAVEVVVVESLTFMMITEVQQDAAARHRVRRERASFVNEKKQKKNEMERYEKFEESKH